MGTALTFAQRRGAVERASRQARWAMGAFLVSAAVDALAGADAADSFASEVRNRVAGARIVVAHLAPSIAWGMAYLLFLVWVYRAVSNAPALGGALTWGPGVAVLACVAPVVSLVLPYFVMRALHRASDPSALQDVPIFRERTDPTYREGGRELLASPRWDLPTPLIAWWILLDGKDLMAGLDLRPPHWVGASCEIAVSVLCVLVVRGIDARQRERCRRLEANEERTAAAV
jgi:Domain of unknown function (DUF4328)